MTSCGMDLGIASRVFRAGLVLALPGECGRESCKTLLRRPDVQQECRAVPTSKHLDQGPTVADTWLSQLQRIGDPATMCHRPE